MSIWPVVSASSVMGAWSSVSALDWCGAVLAGLGVWILGLLPALERRRALHRARAWSGRERGGARRREDVRRWRAAPGIGWTRDPGAVLARVVAEAAARLRAGAPPGEAWAAAWSRLPGLGPMGPLDEGGAPSALVRLARRLRWRDLWAGDGAPGRGPGGRRAALGELLAAGSSRARSGRRAAAALVAACRFTDRLGAPLAGVLDLVADGIDESAAAEDARRIARSGPAMSSRVLTALPLLGVLAGEALGARPFERFTDGGIGTLCLLVGVSCLAAARVVSQRMLRRAEGDQSGAGIDPAILCDLAGAGLESGASVPAVLDALGEAADLPDLGRIGRELVLGVRWGAAWDPCPGPAELVRDALEPAWVDGTSPVSLLARASAQLRTRRIADARARAEELGVRLVVPLGSLLLPAFLALGVVPVLLHLGMGGFAGLG